MKKPDHYSPSQLNMSADCGKKYYYQYLMGLRSDEPKIYFLLGNAVDRTIEFVLSAPKDVLSPSEIFQKELAREVNPVKKRISEEDMMILNKQAVQLEILLTNYISHYVDYEPLSFQRRLSISLKGIGPNIFGYTDIIAKRGDKTVIIDIKTSGRQVNEPSASHRSQLMFYCLALMKADKLVEIPDLELHYLIKTKEPKINIVKVPASEANLYHVVSSIREHDWKIQQGYYPLNRNHLWCSASGCDFHERCHIDCKMEITEALEQCA